MESAAKAVETCRFCDSSAILFHNPGSMSIIKTVTISECQTAGYFMEITGGSEMIEY